MQTDEVEVTINISIRQPALGWGQLQLNETLNMPSMGFLELCKILTKFKALADKLKRGK
jgi:hypothetical protein